MSELYPSYVNEFFFGVQTLFTTVGDITSFWEKPVSNYLLGYLVSISPLITWAYCMYLYFLNIKNYKWFIVDYLVPWNTSFIV